MRALGRGCVCFGPWVCVLWAVGVRALRVRPADVTESDPRVSGSNKSYSFFNVHLFLARKSEYFMWNFALIVFLIAGTALVRVRGAHAGRQLFGRRVGLRHDVRQPRPRRLTRLSVGTLAVLRCGQTSFCIPPDSFADRSSLNLALLLTLTALKV